MPLELKGKTALVCGASQGIGAAAALALAHLGARVALLARTEEKLQDIRRQLPDPEKHFIISCDLNDPEGLKEKVKHLLEQVNAVQILVANAGGPPSGPIIEAQPEEFLKAFQSHLLSSHLLAQMLVPGMKECGYGRIINVISTSVKMPLPNLGVSNTIRGAVANWSKTLAMELGPFGITVNNVLPGYTRTSRLENLLQANAEKTGQSPEQIEQTWLKAVPSRRFGEPQETGAAIAFLASPAASYINGINLPVDGGRTGCL